MKIPFITVMAGAAVCGWLGYFAAGAAIGGATGAGNSAKEASAPRLEQPPAGGGPERATGSRLSQWQAAAGFVAEQPDARRLLEDGLDVQPTWEAEELMLRLASERIIKANAGNPAEIIRLIPHLSYNAQNALVTEWCRSNPEQAAQHLTELQFSSEASAEILARQRPDLIMEMVRKPPQERRRVDWNTVLPVIAATDFEGAVAALKDLPFLQREDMAGRIAAARGKVDFDSTIKWAAGLEGKERESAVVSALGAKIAADPSSALALVKEHRDLLGPNQWLLFQEIAQNDPKQAFALLEQLGDDPSVQSARGSCLDRLCEADPEAVLKLMSEPGYDPNDRSQRLSYAIGHLATSNPEAAAQYALSLPDEADRKKVLNALANSGSSFPPETLQALAEAAGPTSSAAMRFLRHSDPEKAFGIFSAMSQEQRDKELENLGSTGGLAPGQWARWAALGSETLREAQLSRAAAGWASQDPAAAADWVRTLPDGEGRSWAAVNVAVTWSQTDMEAATKWAESLPAGEERKLALTELAGRYASFGDAETAKRLRTELKQGAAK